MLCHSSPWSSNCQKQREDIGPGMGDNLRDWRGAVQWASLEAAQESKTIWAEPLPSHISWTMCCAPSEVVQSIWWLLQTEWPPSVGWAVGNQGVASGPGSSVLGSHGNVTGPGAPPTFLASGGRLGCGEGASSCFLPSTRG